MSRAAGSRAIESRAAGSPAGGSGEGPDRAAWAVLAAAACAIAWRAPIVWMEPRFWGEEGALYFAYARQQGLLASIFFVPTSDFPAGYLLLAASLPATLASLVSLELAPRVTTFFAWLVQLAPLAVVLFGFSPLWPGRVRRVLACGVLVFAPAVVGEVWLNTINSQVFCGLTAALILVSEAPRGRLAFFFRGLLLFCGLSGPYTAFLAPLFWLKTRLGAGTIRREEAVLHWRIVAGAAAAQASIFLWTSSVFPLAPERFEAGRWALRSAAAAYHFVIRALFGETLGLELADLVGLRRPLGTIAEAYWMPVAPATPGGPGADSLVGWISLAVVVAVLLWLGRRAHPLAHLLTAAVVISGVLITVSIGHLYAAGRYAVVPGTLLLLRVGVASWQEGPAPAWRRWSARLVLALALLAGVLGFRGESPPGVFGLAPGRPTWSEEVAAWRNDPGYAMRIWAYNLAVPNRLSLLPAPGDDRDRRALEASGFQLISTGEWATRRLNVGDFPRDFRLVFEFETSRPIGELDIEIRWLDLRRERVAAWPVDRCESREVCLVTLERLDLRGRSPVDGSEIDLSDVGALEIALRSKPARPARLVATRLRVARRLEGALESLFASRRSRSPEGTGVSGVSTGEATQLAMLESWRLDGDFAFGAPDLERVRGRWAPGTPIELRRQDDRLAYRASHLYALLAGTFFGGVGLNLVAALVLVIWAARRGVAPSLAVPFLLASWSGVELLTPGATWTGVLTLWACLALARGVEGGRQPWPAIAVGVLAAVMVLDSPIFLPLALVPLIEHWRRRRDHRRAAASVLVSLLIALSTLAVADRLLASAGALPWWSAGEEVVLAREAFDPAEERTLVIPRASAAPRGIATATEPLWAIPDVFFAPLFAFPLLVVWIFLCCREKPFFALRSRERPAGRGEGRRPADSPARRGDDGGRADVVLSVALVVAAGLAWFLSPGSRVGPPAWTRLYPLLLLLPLDWPMTARRIVQGAAALWILAVLRAFV